MALAAGTGNIFVVESRRHPGAHHVTVVALDLGANMAGFFSSGGDAIVASTATTAQVIMIHMGRLPGGGSVALAAFSIGRHMTCRHATDHGIATIMTLSTI